MDISAGTCTKGRPEDWDLDCIRSTNPMKVHAAKIRCHQCPALAACQLATAELVEKKLPPRLLVQAGELWDYAGKPMGVKEFLQSRNLHPDRDQRIVRAAA